LVDSAASSVAVRYVEGIPEVSAPAGYPSVIRDFFGRSTDRGTGPQGFLVDLYPPHGRTGAHFHDVDQFQVFMGAPGAWYQRTPLDGPHLHYSDAYTTYGPFGTGSVPMSFFTLRPRAASQTRYMPRERAHLVPGGARRNLSVDLVPFLNRSVGPGESTAVVLIEPDVGGLAAHLLIAGNGGALPAVGSTPSGGRYYCVLRGGVIHDGVSYGTMSLGWNEPTAGFGELRADESGCAVLVLQYPQRPRPPRDDRGPVESV
jgi:hypothetical protein